MRIEKQELLTEPNILTVAQAKEHLRLTHSEHDALIKSLILAIEDHLSDLLGVVLRQKKYKIYISPRTILPSVSSGLTATFEVPFVPATVQQVGVFPLDGSGFTLLVPTDDYVVLQSGKNVRILFNTIPNVEDEQIRIDVTVGYAAPVDDPQVKLVTKLLLAHLYHNNLPATETELKKVPWSLGVMLTNLRFNRTIIDES